MPSQYISGEGIVRMATLLNRISKSILIALPKKPEAKECELHRATNPVSYIPIMRVKTKSNQKWQRHNVAL